MREGGAKRDRESERERKEKGRGRIFSPINHPEMDRNGPVEAFSRGFDTTLQKSPVPRRINISQLAGYHAGFS